MALNTTGPLSIGGLVAGQSIALELALSGTAQLGLGCASPRALVSKPTGVISIQDFYGASSVFTTGIYYGGLTGASITVNTTTRINACGALIGAETAVGTTRRSPGASYLGGSIGYFWGGGVQGGASSTLLLTKITKCGVISGTETSVGTAIRSAAAGARSGLTGTLNMFYAGLTTACACTNLLDRINACGTLVGSETNVGTTNTYAYQQGGAAMTSKAMYWGGTPSVSSSVGTNRLRSINQCGALVGTETTAGTQKTFTAGASLNNLAFYYGNSTASSTNLARINNCNALVGQTTVGTSQRYRAGGATIGTIASFYSGVTVATVANTLNRINGCGALVGTETTLGTARARSGGASAK